MAPIRPTTTTKRSGRVPDPPEQADRVHAMLRGVFWSPEKLEQSSEATWVASSAGGGQAWEVPGGHAVMHGGGRVEKKGRPPGKRAEVRKLARAANLDRLVEREEKRQVAEAEAALGRMSLEGQGQGGGEVEGRQLASAAGALGKLSLEGQGEGKAKGNGERAAQEAGELLGMLSLGEARAEDGSDCLEEE
ncbi:hypothetical protein BDV95DRAFT_569306 [Massariosphaeria phaeospora]|uniref:Uncharacterized protein n=1 Tax=Massariosphaeria phaeospora TaxID=100035 RepID=A0A7C8IG11_9PLEO|nr:hypothetical protein BDV95DRAFT_569306 [Massariosphaeria phaeospora]